MTKSEGKIVVIKKSRSGKGIFLKKSFQRNEKIVWLIGKLITCDEDDNLDEKTRSNTLRFSIDKFLSPKREIGDFLNHSCSPNSKIIKKNNKLYVVAIENIEKGSEVLIDYSTILAKDDTWTMKCNCKNKNCRKIVKKFNLLPKKIKQYYIDQKIVPSYILAI